MVWLPIFVFLYFFKKEHLKFLGLGLVVLGIYIFKNIWVFGYPFFPVQMFDIGVSWLPNAEILKQSSEVAILKTYDLKFTISEIQQFTTLNYIYHWFTLHSYKSSDGWFKSKRENIIIKFQFGSCNCFVFGEFS